MNFYSKGIVGVTCCIFGIGAGYGLVMLAGNFFVSFVGTLPFLVLGVGIDDMFIIIDGKFVVKRLLSEFEQSRHFQ